MSDRIFVDTNVLIYAHDVDATIKHAAAKSVLQELWSERSGVLKYAGTTRILCERYPQDYASNIESLGSINREQLLNLVCRIRTC